MTEVELAPIEGAKYATCSECDTVLLIGPDLPLPQILTHEGDGLHGFAGLTRPLSEMEDEE